MEFLSIVLLDCSNPLSTQNVPKPAKLSASQEIERKLESGVQVC